MEPYGEHELELDVPPSPIPCGVYLPDGSEVGCRVVRLAPHRASVEGLAGYGLAIGALVTLTVDSDDGPIRLEGAVDWVGPASGIRFGCLPVRTLRRVHHLIRQQTRRSGVMPVVRASIPPQRASLPPPPVPTGEMDEVILVEEDDLDLVEVADVQRAGGSR